MFRVSKDAWEELGKELLKVYEEAASKSEEERTEEDYIRFNRLFNLDMAVKTMIEEGLLKLSEEGVI